MMMMMMKMKTMHFDEGMKRANGADAYIETNVTNYLNNHEILVSLAFSLQQQHILYFTGILE